MADAKRLLILNIDIDDDLGQKAGIKGPIIGRKVNYEAAAKLALSDPEETDANAMFKAVKVYDELSANHDCEVATLTGHPSLGYKADSNVIEQLEKVLAGFPAEGCVYVTDGASDDQVLPLIQSRIKINSVYNVTVKQTKELEKTYFVILEKLKEPHYARIVFGIPGMLILIFFLGQYFVGSDFGLRLVEFLVGLYLLIKGFGIEDSMLRSLSQFRFSLDKISTLFYFAAFPLIIVSIYLGFDHAVNAGVGNTGRIIAESAKVTLLLLPWSVLLIVIGNALQALVDKKNYLIPDHITQAATVLLLWLVTSVATEWILGNVFFSDFLYAIMLGTASMFLVSHFSKRFKEYLISKMHIEGREVYTEIGSMIGKVVGINRKKGTFIVQTSSGQKLDFGFDYIFRIGDRITIRY